MTTVFAPSSPEATKSLPGASSTSTFTARFAEGARSAVRVNTASPPSVTAAPPAMVTTGSGSSSSVMVTVVEDGLPVATPAGSVAMAMVKLSSRSSVGSSVVWTVKVCEAALAGMVTLAGAAA